MNEKSKRGGEDVISSGLPGKPLAINTATLPLIRFVAAYIVVEFHFAREAEFYHHLPEIFKAGTLMVTFFFVLSGFVLFLGYYQKERIDLQSYFVRRAVKILPLYFLALLLAAIMRGFDGALSFSEVLLNLLCLQSWFPNPLSLNFTSWFVSDLWFFYCVFPPLLFVLKKTRPDGKMLMSLGVLVWAVTQGILTTLYNSDFYTGYPSWSHDLIYFFPPSNFCSFFMGMCGAYLVTTSDFKVELGGGKSLLLSVVIFFALGLMVQFDAELENFLGFELASGAGIYAPVFLILILHLTLARNVMLRMLSWSAFAILGEISYALYILQQPMETLYKYLLPERLSGSPGMYFWLYFVFLFFVAWLLTLLEKAIVKKKVFRPIPIAN